VFVVTGATGALGRAVVQALLAAGGRVAAPWRDGPGFEDLVRAARAGDALWGAQADASDPEALRRLCDDAASALGRIDGLAAVAGGYAGSGKLETAPLQEWDAMLGANLATAYAACRGVLPHLVGRGGSVVTVGSKTAETGGSGAAGYAVSKAAVHALTRVLALENRGRGVRFNCVLPGTIDTPANRRAMPEADFSLWTSPDAIARVIVFLLSPESAPLSGALLPVDGPGR
jgi:NAD(P)-dependent dehydrogenase (short-subunit alcohol dehydrogenase family)